MIHNCNILKVAGIFFEEPSINHYLIEISRKSGLAHTSVKNYLTLLKKEGLIKEIIEKKGKRKFPEYKADLESFSYKMEKKTYNLSEIYNCGIIAEVRDKCMPRSIILFGSYAKGEDIESSDIDLFIESRKQVLSLEKFQKTLKRKIQLHFNSNFKEYPKELKNNIINGNILYGYLEVFV